MAKQQSRLSFLSNKVPSFVLNNLGFVAFLGGLATVYIANAHYAEYNVRRIQLLERQIKEQRWTYMSLQSENMYSGLRSEVMSQVRADGLRLHRGKPHKVVVSPAELEPIQFSAP